MNSAKEALKVLATVALQQMDLGRLTASPGGLRPKKKTCKVSAVGALAYAHYVLENPKIDHTKLHATGYFLLRALVWRKYQIHRDEFRRLDLAFERGNGFHRIESNEDYTAVLFGLRIENKTQRMRAIMQNIIDNNGTFQP